MRTRVGQVWATGWVRGPLRTGTGSTAHSKKLESTWPDVMRQRGYDATQEGGIRVWIDSNRVLEQIRDMAK